ncbi:MAG: hypothetical protein HKN89_02080 [Eudoraea sp.]|nr:hypothetical protein [Eudoraea sp.]
MGIRTAFILIFSFCLVSACQEGQEKHDSLHQKVESQEEQLSKAAIIADLKANGYEIFDYVDEVSGDTLIMQQYFIAFLKNGPNRSQSEAETDSLQILHLNHLSLMYELGHADISGPFGDDGDIRGITVYNTPTKKIADSLANSDPMVKAGRLVIEMHPWWAAKGFSLR